MDINSLRADVILHKVQSYLLHSKGSILSQNLHSSLFNSFLEKALYILLALGLLWILRVALTIKRSLQEPSVILELTPPANAEKTALTTKQLFKTIYDLTRQRTVKERILGYKKSFSFEIVSTKKQGIRYLILSRPQSVRMLKRHLLSYLPQAKLEEVDDYLPKSINELKKYQTKVVEFDLAKHFAYPLEKQNMLDEHDPVAYITGQMTKLAPGELLSYQLILTPTKTRETAKIKEKIIRGEDTLTYLNRFVVPSYLRIFSLLLKSIGFVISSSLSAVGWTVKTLINDASEPYLARRQMQLQYQGQYVVSSVTAKQKPARVLTTFEQEAVKSIEEKIDQKLFQTRVRLLIMVKEKQHITEREQGFISSLGVFSGLSDQSLLKKFHLPLSIVQDYLYLNFKKRLLSFIFNSSPTLLSVSEVADLYHFPFTKVTQTENIVKTLSREIPAPVSLKNGRRMDVVFAQNTYGGTITPIGLTEEERETHLYILGRTGSGKTTLMYTMAKHDIVEGRGLAFIDPHGDVVEDLLACIPLSRKNDLIYVNPIDLKYPIGINILELTPGLNEEETELEKEVVTEGVISLFRKVFSKDENTNAHRIEYILRNTIYTAFTVENCTIFTISRILTNTKFRTQIVSKLKDQDLVDFWKNEFGKAGDFQVIKMTQGVTAKVGRFFRSPTAKRILEQEKSTINFDDIVNNKKILLCNFSQGKLGEDTSRLLGTTIMTKLQQAALKRTYIPKEKRVPFYLYVDEFQSFAAPSFSKMITESRKYRMPLIIAEQSTSQQKDRDMTNIILANVTSVVTFRSGNYIDEELMLNQFSPYLTKGEIMNLPRYRFYMKISALESEEPFSGITVYAPLKKDDKKIEMLIEASRNNWTSKYLSNKVAQEVIRVEEAKDTVPHMKLINNHGGLPAKNRQ